MKIKILVLTAVLFFAFFLTYLGAQETIEVSGAQIPLIAGALPAKIAEVRPVNTRILAYAVDKPLSEVIKFYESFLTENKFLLIGGKEGGSYNVSVKKGGTMFSLMIYSGNNQTIIQFIW